jgi:hypothetical protein
MYRNLGDNSKSSLRSNEQLLQIITYTYTIVRATIMSDTLHTCVVFSKWSEKVKHSSIGQNLQNEDLNADVNAESTKPTISRPRTLPCREPYLKSRRPPAFVETLPPI